MDNLYCLTFHFCNKKRKSHSINAIIITNNLTTSMFHEIEDLLSSYIEANEINEVKYISPHEAIIILDNVLTTAKENGLISTFQTQLPQIIKI